jgi:hypothetical protein
MTRALLAIAFLAIVWGFTFGYWCGRPDATYRPVPACQEDTVLIGAGDFEPAAEPHTGGRWSVYVCGPAVDDFEEVLP